MRDGIGVDEYLRRHFLDLAGGRVFVEGEKVGGGGGS
jgi:hypothetical protein